MARRDRDFPCHHRGGSRRRSLAIHSPLLQPTRATVGSFAGSVPAERIVRLAVVVASTFPEVDGSRLPPNRPWSARPRPTPAAACRTPWNAAATSVTGSRWTRIEAGGREPAATASGASRNGAAVVAVAHLGRRVLDHRLVGAVGEATFGVALQAVGGAWALAEVFDGRRDLRLGKLRGEGVGGDAGEAPGSERAGEEAGAVLGEGDPVGAEVEGPRQRAPLLLQHRLPFDRRDEVGDGLRGRVAVQAAPGVTRGEVDDDDAGGAADRGVGDVRDPRLAAASGVSANSRRPGSTCPGRRDPLGLLRTGDGRRPGRVSRAPDRASRTGGRRG